MFNKMSSSRGKSTTQYVPILGLDMWEHSYYLQYQNNRPAYVKNFFHVINWQAVNENLEIAMRTEDVESDLAKNSLHCFYETATGIRGSKRNVISSQELLEEELEEELMNIETPSSRSKRRLESASCSGKSGCGFKKLVEQAREQEEQEEQEEQQEEEKLEVVKGVASEQLFIFS